MENQKYASELPYPSIDVDKNVAESKMLMPSYAGSASELSHVMTYVFQSYVTQRYPEIAKAMQEVAIVEMHHHELLGKAIYALGGYPVMGARTWWNGNYASYTLDPKKYLVENIRGEKNAIINYERTILNLTDESVKTLLGRIIIDEEIHIKVFKDLLSNYFDIQA